MRRPLIPFLLLLAPTTFAGEVRSDAVAERPSKTPGLTVVRLDPATKREGATLHSRSVDLVREAAPFAVRDGTLIDGLYMYGDSEEHGEHVVIFDPEIIKDQPVTKDEHGYRSMTQPEDYGEGSFKLSTGFDDSYQHYCENGNEDLFPYWWNACIYGFDKAIDALFLGGKVGGVRLDERTRVEVGTTQFYLSPESGIGYVRFYDDPLLPRRCSASVVGDNWILTAAHCVQDENGNWLSGGVGSSGRGRFCLEGWDEIPDYDEDDAADPGFYDSTRCFNVNARWSGAWNGNVVGEDYTLLRVTETIPWAYRFPISSRGRSEIFNQQATITGFPRVVPYSNPTPQDPGIEYPNTHHSGYLVGGFSIYPLNQNLFPMAASTRTVLWYPSTGKIIGSRHTVSKRSSGSPIYMNFSGVSEIVGVAAAARWTASNGRDYTAGPQARTFKSHVDTLMNTY